MVVQACHPSIQEDKGESLKFHDSPVITGSKTLSPKAQKEDLQDTYRSQNDTNQTVYNCLCAKRRLITFCFLGNR